MGIDLLFDWLGKNKEWLFSGVGVTIVAVVFTALRRYSAGASRAGSATPSAGPSASMLETPEARSSPPSRATALRDAMPVSSEAAITPLSPVPVSSSRAEVLPTPSNLAITDAMNAVAQAPLLQRVQVAEHYRGIRVCCSGRLVQLMDQKTDATSGQSYVQAIVQIGDNFAYAIFDLAHDAHPGLGILRRGTPIVVEGVIDNLDDTFVRLRDVEVKFSPGQ